MYKLKSGSSLLGTRLAERIIKDPKFNVDSTIDVLSKVDFKTPCQKCISENQRLIIRRSTESRLVQSLQSKDPKQGPYFAINSEWANDWSFFVNFEEEESRVVSKFLYDQFPPPSRINNSAIASEDQKKDVN